MLHHNVRNIIEWLLINVQKSLFLYFDGVKSGESEPESSYHAILVCVDRPRILRPEGQKEVNQLLG